MDESAQRSGARPLVCPFVALAEDRNRRAEVPDQRSRCYAEPAPRQRDLAYQADYCYSPDFPTCSVFLAWAARNAAEPAYAREAADAARLADAGTSSPDGAADVAATHPGTPVPTPEGGLFGLPPERESASASGGSEQIDWVSASAWAEAPWDEQAEAEAEELAAATQSPADEDDEYDDADDVVEEDLVGPKVPAALPMRRRRTRQRPIRSRGSGEWFYADPLDREPLVRRRYGITPPIMLGVLGLLVGALIVFLIPTLLAGGGDGQVASAPTASPGSARPNVTRAPAALATPQLTLEPSPEPPAQLKTYRVKSGDSLSLIAQRHKVSLLTLQCINGIKNPNLLQLDQRLTIPPQGYACVPGWRRGATPPPQNAESIASPAAATEPSAGVQ